MSYYNQRGYQPQRTNYGYNRPNYQPYQPQKPIKKHSGAKFTTYTPTTGKNANQLQYLVTAWRLNRSKELISVKAVTTEKSRLSDKGWFGSVAVTFTNTTTGEVHFHWGTMQKSTGKVVIDKLAVVINPKAKNGGYCGTYLKK